MNEKDYLIDKNEYEERADFISNHDLELWNVDNEFVNRIQKKIMEKGAKLEEFKNVFDT